MKNMVETTAGANLVMKAVFAICAFILAIVLLPAGTAHAAYSIPSNAQDSGTSGGCTWYITSASASSDPGQLVIYPTNGTSGTLASIKQETSSWVGSTAIQSIYVAPGVKTSSSFKYVFRECTSLVSADITNLDTSGATDISGLFYGCTALKSIDGIEDLNVAKVTALQATFWDCESLTSLDLSKWNCASLTSLYETFEFCAALKTLELPSSMPKLTNASYAFNSCYALTSLDVSCFENGMLEEVDRMFQNCKALTSLTGYEEMVTSKVTDVNGVFGSCHSIPSLDISKWDTSNVTAFNSLFGSCRSITSIKGLDVIDTSKGKNFSYMFAYCIELPSITFGTNFKTSAGTNFSYMFDGDESLKVLDISMFDTSAATNMKKMLGGMDVLQQVSLGAKFSFTGNGTATECVLPTPNPAYIDGATGNWQAVGSGTVSAPAGKVYAPADVPSNVAETYVMEVEEAKEPILAETTTWYKGSAEKSTYTTINIVDSYAPTGTEKESWDASAAQDGSVMAYVSADGKTLTLAGNGSGYVKANENSMTAFDGFASVAAINGLSLLDTSDTLDMSAFFADNTSLTSVAGIENWDVSKCTTFAAFFSECTSLTGIDLSKWDMASAQTIGDFFYNCESLVDLKTPEKLAGNLVDIYHAFESCEKLESVDVSFMCSGKIEYADCVFQSCSSLKTITGYETLVTSSTEKIKAIFNCCNDLEYLDLSRWVTDNVISLRLVFGYTYSLATIDGLENWNVGNVEDMSAAFRSCWATDLSGICGWDVSSVESFNSTFRSAVKLTSLDLSSWSTDSAEDMSNTFNYCPKLVALKLGPGFSTENVVDFSGFLARCENLKTLDISMVDTSAASSMTDFFAGMIRLQQVTLGDKFSFTGDGSTSCVLPTPDPQYIPGATGSWQAVASGTVDAPEGTVYAPADVPSNVAETYVMEAERIPVLAPSSSWCYGHIEKSDIAIINIVDSYTPDGTELKSWDASAEQNKSVMAYLSADGTMITIAGNGYGFIYANADSNEAFAYFDNLLAINGAEVLNTVNVTNLNYGFCGNPKLISVDLDSWDVSNVTQMCNLFQWCESLESLGENGLRDWDTGKVELMGAVFENCKSLAFVDVSGWDVSATDDLGYMFSGCTKLAAIDVSNWDVSNITGLMRVFRGCAALEELDLSGWKTGEIYNMEEMFSGCAKLEKLDLSGFDSSSAKWLEGAFDGMVRLQQVTLGEGFSFTGNGTSSCVLPTPDPAYITGAIGKWQAVGTGTTDVPLGTIYLPADVPSNVAETYVMPLTTISVDVPIKVTLAAKADGTWCTPTATANQIVNHSLAPVKVVSAESSAADGFSMLANASVKSSTKANVFGGTITAGAGAAQDLTAIDTSASAWTMAAETDADDSDLISLQLAGSIGNVEGKYLTDGCKLFDITYTFELAL